MVFLYGVGINREKKELQRHIDGLRYKSGLYPSFSFFGNTEKSFTFFKSFLLQPSVSNYSIYKHIVEFIPQYLNSTFSSINFSFSLAGSCFPRLVPEKLRIRPGPIRGAPECGVGV